MRKKPTISITIDEFVIKVVDGVAENLGISRSAVIEMIIRKELVENGKSSK